MMREYGMTPVEIINDHHFRKGGIHCTENPQEYIVFEINTG